MKSLSTRNPHLLVMLGLPGSGRREFAEEFAEMFSAPLVEPSSLAQFARDETAAVQLAQIMLTQMLCTKVSIVYDGPSSTRTERLALAKQARAAGYTPLFIWVQVDTPTARSRATHHRAEPAPITIDEFEHAERRFTAPSTSEQAVVISGKHTYAAQVKVVLHRLADNMEPGKATVPTPVAPRPRGPIIIR